MLETLDIVTTAKLRGIVKKLGIKYVTDSASYFPAQCDGIHIWQNGNAIYFKTFKDNDKIYLSQFVSALNELGLTITQMLTILGEVKGTYRIVPKVGA
jgi:hypothetical protein